jgi:hypothetical protein
VRGRALLVLVACAAAVPAGSAQAAYSPAFSLELSDTRPAAAPAVVARVSQPPGQSANRRLAVRYPPQFGFNPGFAVKGCPPANERADACPEESRIGTSRAVFLFGEFSGPVYITPDFRLLSYLEGFGGVGRQRFEGRLYLRSDGSIETVFDNLPNFPTTLSETRVAGGSRGILLTPRRCGRYTVAGSFTSHAGEQVTANLPIDVAGCAKRPVIRALRARPRRFRTRAILAWRLSQPALRTSVSLQRRERSQWRELRRLRGPGRLGKNSLRISARRLRAGRYRVVLRAVGGRHLVSRSRAIAVRVLPRG